MLKTQDSAIISLFRTENIFVIEMLYDTNFFTPDTWSFFINRCTPVNYEKFRYDPEYIIKLIRMTREIGCNDALNMLLTMLSRHMDSQNIKPESLAHFKELVDEGVKILDLKEIFSKDAFVYYVDATGFEITIDFLINNRCCRHPDAAEYAIKRWCDAYTDGDPVELRRLVIRLVCDDERHFETVMQHIRHHPQIDKILFSALQVGQMKCVLHNLVKFTHELEIHDVIVFLCDIYPRYGCGRYSLTASDTPGMDLYTKITSHFVDSSPSDVAIDDFYDEIVPDIRSLMEIDRAQ